MKDTYLQIRISREDKAQVEKRAADLGMSVSQFIRLLARGKKIITMKEVKNG